MSKHSKYFNVASYVVLGLALASMALVIFWLTFPYKTVEMNSYTNVTNTVKTGDNFIATADFCSWTGLPRTVTAQLRDGIVWTLPVAEVPGKPLSEKPSCNMLNLATHIPETLPPGEYTLFVNTEFKVNPLRTMNLQYHSQPFQVIK